VLIKYTLSHRQYAPLLLPVSIYLSIQPPIKCSLTKSFPLVVDRATNYGVVRLTLLEHLYEKLYTQRLLASNPSEYKARIRNHRTVISATQTSGSSSISLRLAAPPSPNLNGETISSEEEEELEVDYIFTATGYIRNAHEDMLHDVQDLTTSGKFEVQRDYRVKFAEGVVDSSHAGVWLQGCNESTHGVRLFFSFSLLFHLFSLH
jgi:L-ornithine N5-oxygenase